MELKVNFTSDTIIFYTPMPEGEMVLYNYDIKRFSKLLSRSELEAESTLLQEKFKKITGEERGLSYFENIITTVIEKVLFSKMDQVKLDNLLNEVK